MLPNVGTNRFRQAIGERLMAFIGNLAQLIEQMAAEAKAEHCVLDCGARHDAEYIAQRAG